MPTAPPRFPSPLRSLRWVAPLSLIVLGLATTSAGFRNQFTQDDLPLVVSNATVHSLLPPTKFFTHPYWDDPFAHSLYRPLLTATLAVEWAVGGGNPLLYRVVSALLLLAVGIALFRLAALLLPAGAAWAGAALFMVHPLHVEATAPAVNQGELVVGLLLCLASAAYIRARRAGGPGPAASAILVLLYAVAALYRETGLILPLLLLAAECTVLRNPQGRDGGAGGLRSLYLALGLVAALVLAARSLVLGGDVVGTVPAEALAQSGLAGRALTMLGVVPTWLRLLVWPAALQTDYGPNEIVAATGWGAAQWAGALIVVAWAVCVLAWRRKSPVLAFGLLWTAIALLPVSNVLVPTGILLAERTLFLASAGVALAAGATLAAIWKRTEAPPGLVRWPVAAAVGGLLVLGMLRSNSRSRDWTDQKTLLEQTALDAPRSYAAHLALSRFLADSGSRSVAEAHYREAIALKPVLLDQERSMADQYRLAGFCRPAVRHYRGPLLLRPGDVAVRKSLVTCLLELERYDEVGAVAGAATQDPAQGAFFREAIRVADSALAAPRRTP